MAQIACIGGGLVGGAWALVFARAGHRVAIYDKDTASLQDHCLPGIVSTLSLLDSCSLLDEPIEAILSRIWTAPTLQEAVAEASYVQESVREDLTIKRAVFADIAKHAPIDCILASSTSALRGSDFLSDIIGPERALVAHPVNPPSLIPLVELCATQWTSPETLEQARALLEAAQMKPITVKKEIDGYILNRLQYTLVAEAMHLVGEGYCSPEDIDRVMTDGLALRWASVGPFETAHLNAAGGFADFVAKLGDMMKTMGQAARTDYAWGDRLAQDIHAAMEKQTSVDDIPKRQAWRDSQILAARAMQKGA
ncbi:MAG: 3-hydroxyacyl-CoA dehydrogenase [Pseudomonadota bacterium]